MALPTLSRPAESVTAMVCVPALGATRPHISTRTAPDTDALKPIGLRATPSNVMLVTDEPATDSISISTSKKRLSPATVCDQE